MSKPHPSHPPQPASACSPAQLQGWFRDPQVPAGWLREAAKVAAVQGNPRLLSRLAEHPNLPEDTLQNLARVLPWEALAKLMQKSSASPALQAACKTQLIRTWAKLDPVAMGVFARKAPRPLWNLIWKTAEPRVLAQFFHNPALEARDLVELLQSPLTQTQAEALRDSRFLRDRRIVERVLTVMAESFQDPATDLVLGLAAPWIMALPPQDCLELAASLPYAPLERLAQTWASRIAFSPPA